MAWAFVALFFAPHFEIMLVIAIVLFVLGLLRLGEQGIAWNRKRKCANNTSHRTVNPGGSTSGEG
jgi:hypothetical protein